MARLTVTFLGTSSATPTRSRALPSIVIERNGTVIIMDCGEGMQRSLIKAGIGLNKETIILISHLHGDHVSGLLGLLQTMTLAQRTKPLTIIAPSDLKEWLDVTARLLHVGMTFEVNFTPCKVGKVYEADEYSINVARAIHTIESYSFKITEKERPGVFYPEKAIALGVPEGKLWSKLQHGKKVVINGRVVKPEQVVGPKRPGRVIGYSGDTRPSETLLRFFSGCDLLIFDSTFSEMDRDKAVERKHSTALEAAQLAKKANVKKLVLTHFSARYRRLSKLLNEARTVFPNSILAYDGLRIDVPYPDSKLVSHSMIESISSD